MWCMACEMKQFQDGWLERTEEIVVHGLKMKKVPG